MKQRNKKKYVVVKLTFKNNILKLSLDLLTFKEKGVKKIETVTLSFFVLTDILNPFVPNAPFSENRKISDVFRR